MQFDESEQAQDAVRRRKASLLPVAERSYRGCDSHRELVVQQHSASMRLLTQNLLRRNFSVTGRVLASAS